MDSADTELLPGSSGSGEWPTPKKKSAVKSRVSVSLQSVRLLPPGFTFTAGSPPVKDGGGFELGAVEDDEEGNDDSPYSSKAASMDGERGSGGAEELVDSATSRQTTVAAAPMGMDSRWGDTSSYAAKKKLQAWCQLPNGEWALGKVESTSGAETVLSLPEGKVIRSSTEDLLPANPEILDGVDDLMQLNYLHGHLYFLIGNTDTREI